MFPKLRKIVLVLIALWAVPSHASTFIKPKPEMVHLARQLAYKDFPRASDILTIMRIESAFNPHAINKMSNGIMQVNYGSFDFRVNMRQGVSLLREYYLITHSKMGAIKAYNIGIGNYLKGHLRYSAEDYWDKFRTHFPSYARYEAHYRDSIPTESASFLFKKDPKEWCFKQYHTYDFI